MKMFLRSFLNPVKTFTKAKNQDRTTLKPVLMVVMEEHI